MSRVTRSGVHVEPELTSCQRDAYLLELLEQWASEGHRQRRRYRRRKLAIAVLRSNGWKLRQIAEAFNVHTCRVGHLIADLRRSVGNLTDLPEKKG